ncbi:MAG: LutB/LldF family L-lactate oxidation iron-sulfur protein, partial [Anaerolineae bacterium]|nr:LutB/LldF family L-lactate oxidation iron-sulfur protein [Caldilineales bacterium]MDW8269280.1 LutB/LldF family L-lactate oxidation iron-sulfur protein [Anaerolineae bacterium]
RAAQANGSRVYWARDAAEACRLVVAIAQERNARRIVKSKSMLTEEIRLNEALEAAGLEVLETDLGEYIVQLGHDHPSHIVAPIVHKRLEDVAALFHEHLGTPLAADIPTLTAAARAALRRHFLQADLGITGANFAVAETGSIVLVTNEGNGRFVTTTPRVHVALVGIERVVPTLAEVGTLLQLLAASATGQPLSTYTTFITGPRRHPDEDGPEEVHIILVDNGRTQALAGELAEILYCIRCGACLNVCPVYRNVGGHAYGAVYPGPVGIVVNPALQGLGPWHELPQASSLCGACTEACPVRIDIPRMLLRLRAASVDQGHAPGWLRWGIRLYAWAAVHPRFFRLGGRLAAWGQRLLPGKRNGWNLRLPGPLAGWTASRGFPPLARESFSRRWARRHHGR